MVVELNHRDTCRCRSRLVRLLHELVACLFIPCKGSEKALCPKTVDHHEQKRRWHEARKQTLDTTKFGFGNIE